jgi:hypothetical protein
MRPEARGEADPTAVLTAGARVLPEPTLSGPGVLAAERARGWPSHLADGGQVPADSSLNQRKQLSKPWTMPGSGFEGVPAGPESPQAS